MRRLLVALLTFCSTATAAHAELYIELPNGRWLCVPNGLLLFGVTLLAAAIFGYVLWYLAENWEAPPRRNVTPWQPSATTHYERETARYSELSRQWDEEAARDQERLRAALQHETLNFEDLFRRFDAEMDRGRGR